MSWIPFLTFVALIGMCFSLFWTFVEYNLPDIVYWLQIISIVALIGLTGYFLWPGVFIPI